MIRRDHGEDAAHQRCRLDCGINVSIYVPGARILYFGRHEGPSIWEQQCSRRSQVPGKGELLMRC